MLILAIDYKTPANGIIIQQLKMCPGQTVFCKLQENLFSRKLVNLMSKRERYRLGHIPFDFNNFDSLLSRIIF